MGVPKVPSVRLLFKDVRATPAVLELLEDTRVGRMPDLALIGVQEEVSDLEETVSWPEDEEGSGMPHYDGASSSGVGKGYIEKPAAIRKGLRAVCSGL